MHWSRPKYVIITIICLLTAILSVADARALQIVTPSDGALLENSGHLIIKAGDTPPIDGLSVDINGVKSDIISIAAPDYRKLFKDLLILQADFDPGENTVVVEGYAGGRRVAEARIQVYLRGEYNTPPARYRELPFHLAEREALCGGCHHNLKPTPQELAEPSPVNHPCASCHGKLIDRKHVHGPAGVFECTSCHDVASKPAKYAVPDRDGAFCLDCHQDKYDDFRKAKRMHGPVEVKQCLVCHDPHASDSLAQIRGNVNASCLRCHASLASGQHVVRGFSGQLHPLEGLVNPSDPSKPLNCASCHEPHSADLPAYLRGTGSSTMVFCRRCHNK
jgi:predicted CXXCH cytochrome family protein